MRYKKIMLVALVLLAILTIGAVSASDGSDELAANEVGAGNSSIAETPSYADEILGNTITDGGEPPVIGDEDDEFVDEGDDYEDDSIIEVWFNYEDNGNIYTDTPSEIVCISVPYGIEGTVYVDVNGEQEGSWKIEFYENYDSYYWWALSDLNITEEGNYTITVKLDDEILKEENLEVLEFNNETFRFVYDSMKETFSLYCPDGAEGTLTVTTVKDPEVNDEEIYHETFDVADYRGWSEWYLSDLEMKDDGILREFLFNITNTDDEEVISFYKRLSIYADEEDWNDADNGVIIDVFEDCDFELEGDLNKIFASVSVFNNLQGNITISVYDEDADEDLLYFNKNISEITESEDDDENENFTVYKIKLSDLNDFDDFITQGMFTIAFSTEDGGVVDNRKYYIRYEDCGIIIFYIVDDDGDDDESYGEGKEIEVEFRDANVIINDAIAIIPKENIPDDAADEFSAIVIYEGDEYSSVVLNLTVLDSDGENYYIYVNDLLLPEIGESVEVGIVLQFFNDVGEKAYYAQQYDNDYQSDVLVYTSPYIVDEAYLLSDDWVISFRQMPNVDDEFIVSVFFNGTYIVQKTFRQSDFIDDEDDDEAIYEIKLSDLGINQTGIHVIEINLTSDGSPSAYTYGVVDIDSFGIIPFEPENDEGLPVFTDVSEIVFAVRVTDDVSGFVRIYLNNTQVGQDIDLADLCFLDVPPFNGRLIYLNDFAVDKTGSCDFKVEVYDENGTLLRNMASLYDVEVTPNGVEFSDWGYGFEPNAFINFHLGTPIDRDAYFNIYLNGKKAGKYSIADGFEFSDGFVDQFYGGRILKPGHYDVNVTFFDGEKETDFDTGSFNVNLLNVTSDKKVYLYNVDDTIITFYFDIDTREGNQDRLDAYYIEDWGLVGADLNMIFNPFFTPAEDEDADISEVYDFNTNIGTFDAAWFKFGNYGYRLHLGTNYVLVTFLEGWHGEPKVMWGGIVSFEVVDHISADPELTITAGDVNYGEDVTLSVNADESFVGYVAVQIGDSKYSVYVVNGTGSLMLSGLSAKTYDAIATYGGNGYYGAGEANTKFTVNKLNSTIALTGDIEFSFGQTGSTNVTYANATGVNASVVGHPEAVVNVKGNAIEVSGLAAGDYTLTVTTIVDENHNPATATANINVFKVASSVAIDVGSSFNVGDEIVINVTSTADVTVVINNRAYEVKDGKVVINSSELGAGNFTVFATVEGSSANATFTINLIGTEIIVANETIDLYTLGHAENVASLNPADAGVLTFVSSDENVVSIIYGVIFANSTGTATVTVSFAGNNKYAAAENKTITVNVRLKDASVSVENDTLDLKVDDRYNINATTVPGFLSVEYASSDESVATVTDYGLVTAVGEGTAIITVTLGNDITYAVNSTNVTVKVSRLPSEIVTVKDSIDMKVNGEFGAPAGLMPSDAGSLTYVISDETVVSIVNDTIVAVGAGKANVTYSFAGNYKYAAAESKTIQVTVEALDAGVNVSKTSYNLNVGDNDTIVVVTVPAGLKVNFATDDDNVVSVDSQGNIVALGVGNATVIVSVGDNRIYKYDSVVVDVSVTAKELSKIITNATFRNYFDENGTYVADLDEITFEGEFTGLGDIEFNQQINITGQNAVFTDMSFKISADNVSVSNIEFHNTKEVYSLIAKAANLLNLNGNRFTGKNSISIEKSKRFTIGSNKITCDKGDDATGVLIKGSSSGVVKDNIVVLKTEYFARGINTNPLGQKLDVEYTHNTITAQSKYAVGIYDDSELIKDNEITLICDYGVGIVVLSDDTTVENNKVIVKASNEGSGEIPDENIGETSGIVVKASAKIINNIVESTAKSISVIEGSSTISDNQLTGSVSVSSDGNTLSGNTIVTDEKYAIDLGNSAGNTVSGNDLHAGDSQGSDTINSGNGSNSISGNDVKVDPKIVAKDATVQYSAGKYYSVTVYGDDGKVASGVEVTFTLNGKKVAASRTNANGVAQFKVTQTPVTNAKLVSSALGVSATAKLTVKHLVTLKAVKVKKSAKKLVLQATLAKLNGKYLKNKKVTFKFNGKKYTAKTNKKGVAKVTIKSSVLKKLKVGKKVTCQATYSKDTVKKTVKVKK